jgi:hypothetical protein
MIGGRCMKDAMPKWRWGGTPTRPRCSTGFCRSTMPPHLSPSRVHSPGSNQGRYDEALAFLRKAIRVAINQDDIPGLKLYVASAEALSDRPAAAARALADFYALAPDVRTIADLKRRHDDFISTRFHLACGGGSAGFLRRAAESRDARLGSICHASLTVSVRSRPAEVDRLTRWRGSGALTKSE